MTPIESILYMIWRGLAVGVLISAPMGPVGILCIQRTLDKGRKAGFYTGIGAAISDLLYCLLTGFGLSFIEDFLNENQNVIQLIGSLVLIAFSVYLFKKNPSSSLRRPLPQDVSAKKNMLGGFLFTFSNPLIIFLIIGLFARFNFTAPEIRGGFYAIGYLFIILGALGWWYGVTYLIDKVRAKFNMNSMKKMNIIIGIVILAFAFVGIVTSLLGLFSPETQARSFQPAVRAERAEGNEAAMIRHHNSSDTDKEIVLYDFSRLAAIEGENSQDGFILDFKLANNACHPSKKFHYMDADGNRKSTANPPWGIVFRDAAGEVIAVMFHCVEYSPTPLSSQTALCVEASLPGGLSFSRTVESGADMTAGMNHYRLSIDPEEGLIIRLGNRALIEPIIFSTNARGSNNFGKLNEIVLLLTPGADISIGREMLRLASSPALRKTELTAEDISYRILHSYDPTEGEWRIFDYTIEEDNLRLGGDYVISIIRREDGVYEMIYQRGAKVQSSGWQPGMLKAILTPTGIGGVYDVEWYDTSGLPVQTKIAAQLDGDLLTFQFPALKSTLRFARLSKF